MALVEAPDPSAGGKGLWFAVVQCHECGLCFTNPRPDQVSITQFYPADGYPPYHPRRHHRPNWLRRWWHHTRRDGQAVPDAEVHVYRGGHLALVTEAEELAPVVEEFLDRD